MKSSLEAQSARSRTANGQQHLKVPRIAYAGDGPRESAPLTGSGAWHSYLVLSAVTMSCLVLFSGRAFHIDDTLFVWTAKHITKHPLNPYGFDLIWDQTRLPMAEVTQNPPLASYYAALAGALAGWSERSLHFAFLLPAVVLILGTYRIAQRFTQSPMLAAMATLLTPGFLVSASSVMCDTTMLAIWMLAAISWVEGEDKGRPLYRVISGLLVGASALTKYFGAALIPLFLVYSLMRRRRLGTWVLPLTIPVLMLATYEFWTASLYERGLLSRAAEFAGSLRDVTQVPYLAKALVGTSFAGGCALTVPLSAFLLWSRKQFVVGVTLATCAGTGILLGWVDLGMQLGNERALPARQQHWFLIGMQLVLCIGGGISILALAISDFWKNRNAESVFLLLWVLGTFVFAGFLNWTVNARSVLPLIPAASILLARRVGSISPLPGQKLAQVVAVLVVSAAVSLWIAAADARLANDARGAAELFCQMKPKDGGTLWFEGHWGFQYYMELCGARPVDYSQNEVRPGDLVVIPDNNVQLMRPPPNTVESTNVLEIADPYWATTTRWEMGAGFYSALWGPLPFVIGPVPSERYELLRLSPGANAK